MLILSFFVFQRSPEQSSYFSLNAIEYLADNSVGDMNNPYIGPGGALHLNGNITNLENSLLTQVGEFYYRNQSLGCTYCFGLANSFLSSISNNFISSQYNMYVFIDGHVVYNKSIIPPEESLTLVPAKRFVTGVYGGNLWGPYIAEVWTWK